MIKFESDYNNFILDNKHLTKCQKKIFMEMKKDIEKFYVKANTNIQIKTYYDNCIEANNILAETKLKILFNRFITLTNVNKIIDLMNKNKINKDSEIIKMISNLRNDEKMNSHKYNKDKYKKLKYKKCYFENICSSWDYIFEDISLNILDSNDINKNSMYLDVGCGFGNKTISFGKKIGIEEKNIHGTDINSWGPYEQNEITRKFNFKEIIDGKLQYMDETFDIITCFEMLHHVEKLDEFIDEIKRILKPNGIIVIVEHNCLNDYDHLILDIQHMMYGTFVDKNKTYLSKPVYSKYYNWVEWDYIFWIKKINYIKGNFLFTSVSNDVRYDNIFYGIYKK